MKLKIGFIGSGNVARHLARALNAVGHDIIQIISRTKSNAQALADEFDCSSEDSISLLNDSIDLCVVCVSDDQLSTVIEQIPSSDRIVVHTCGSQSMDLLQNVGPNYGILYPLQSFSKDRTPDITTVPFLLESSNTETLIILHDIASSLSHFVLTADSKTRLKYHLSAVLVNNFVNHLYSEAEIYLNDNELDFNVLKPIIKETAFKIQNMSPTESQTGPAKRGDVNTIEKHLELLKSDKQLSELYTLLSKSINRRKF